MKRALVAALFVLGCKDSKPADQAAKEAPTPTEQPSKQARPRPQLDPGAAPLPNEDGRDRPRLRDGSGSDGANWDDPAWREERRARMEERRQRREEMLDTNKDGVISDEERVQRMEPMRKRLDTDGDGKLTPEELGASEQRRMSFDDPAAVDTNKDGDISLAELDKAVSDRRAQMRERWRGRGEARDAVRGDKPRP